MDGVEEGILVRCRCGYEWIYKGTNKYPACPKCLSRISLKKNRVDEKEGIK